MSHGWRPAWAAAGDEGALWETRPGCLRSRAAGLEGGLGSAAKLRSVAASALPLARGAPGLHPGVYWMDERSPFLRLIVWSPLRRERCGLGGRWLGLGGQLLPSQLLVDCCGWGGPSCPPITTFNGVRAGRGLGSAADGWHGLTGSQSTNPTVAPA